MKPCSSIPLVAMSPMCLMKMALMRWMLVVCILSLLNLTIFMILTRSPRPATSEFKTAEIIVERNFEAVWNNESVSDHTSATTHRALKDGEHFSQADTNSRDMASSDTSSPLSPIYTTVNRACKDKRCSSLISPVQRRRYKSCEAFAFHHTRVDPVDIPVQCAFRESRGRVPVALVSVPGSGNSWVRGLLEKATGICTGSIYCDSPLRIKGFVGESVRDGGVLVVKSHTSDYQWRGVKLEKRNLDDALYGSAILLVRNPFDTFISERNRIQTLTQMKRRKKQTFNGDLSHVNEVDKDEFGSNQKWEKYVHAIGERWRKTIVKWFGSAHRLNYPILVVHYEEVQKDSLKQVARMLNFLDFDYSSTDLEAALAGGFEGVRRKHEDQYEHYTEDQKGFVRSVITSTLETLESMGVDCEGLNLNKYLCANSSISL